MKTMSAFLAMGGYGAFVWSAYLAMFILFLANLFIPMKQSRKIKARMRKG